MALVIQKKKITIQLNNSDRMLHIKQDFYETGFLLGNFSKSR